MKVKPSKRLAVVIEADSPYDVQTAHIVLERKLPRAAYRLIQSAGGKGLSSSLLLVFQFSRSGPTELGFRALVARATCSQQKCGEGPCGNAANILNSRRRVTCWYDCSGSIIQLHIYTQNSVHMRGLVYPVRS